jgi:hypothetical protein
LAQEVETLEAYGEAAGAKTNIEETARLKRESKSLEKKISSLQRQNESSKKRAVQLAQAYRQKERLALKMQTLANAREREFNRLQSRNDGLKARVESAEQRVIRQIERRKAAEQALAQAQIENRELQGRQRLALQNFRREQSKTTRLRQRTNQVASRRGAGPSMALQ